MYCDVVDMNACSLIFDRPCQYNVNAKHLGRDNLYKILLWVCFWCYWMPRRYASNFFFFLWNEVVLKFANYDNSFYFFRAWCACYWLLGLGWFLWSVDFKSHIVDHACYLTLIVLKFKASYMFFMICYFLLFV